MGTLQRYPDYTRERLLRLTAQLRENIWPQRHPVDSLQAAGPVDRLTRSESLKVVDYKPAKLGQTFGPVWSTHWFKVQATIPPEWKGKRVDLFWNSHSEATLWMGNKSVQGLNFEPAGYEGGARCDAMLRMA